MEHIWTVGHRDGPNQLGLCAFQRIDKSFVLGRKLAMGYGGFISVMFGISQIAVTVLLYSGVPPTLMMGGIAIDGSL